MIPDKRSIKNTDNYKDKKISIALMSSFLVLTIQYFILVSFNLMDSSIGNNVQLLSKIIVGIIYLYVLPTVFKKSMVKMILTYFIAIFIFLINFLLFPENQPYIMDLIFPLFFMGLPSFIYSMSIENWIILKQIMKKVSLIVLIFGAFVGFQIIFGNASIGSYSMSLSYYMLLPSIIYIDELFSKLSLKSLLFTFLSLLIIFALGSRGAILCILVFVLFSLIRSHHKIGYKHISFYLVIFGASLIMLLNLKQVLLATYEYLLGFGINSRSLQLFLRDDIYLSGREGTYENTINEILDHPLFGIGIGGDRHFSNYAHNIFLEILANFGIVVGLVLIILLITAIVKSLFTKSKETYNMLIMWLALGFVHLMVSSSYLLEFKFWIFMGLVANSLLYSINSKYVKKIN